MDAVSRIATAVLYEGYVLWPYRRSALKNRQRWTFGAVLPAPWAARHPDDSCVLQGQYLVRTPPGARVTATLRFLHVVERRLADPAGQWVDELHAAGRRYLAWEEATERELTISAHPPERTALDIPAGSADEPLPEAAGTIVRTWEAIEGEVESDSEPVEAELSRVTVRVTNRTAWDGEDRQVALRHALVSTHVALRVTGGAFVSLTDPPAALREHAEACRNVGTWPVLVGEEGDYSTLLSAPIILEDYPRIAPESPGDLFDGGEIDQLLILNILAMTEEEQREMRDSDPRTAEILDRCRALGRDELMNLHGAIREFGPVEP